MNKIILLVLCIQVGLAVGDTASERARATLIRLGLQVLEMHSK